LVFRMNWDLKEPAIIIKIAKELVFDESLEHLINEWKRKMIFSGCYVELLVVDAHPLAVDYPR
jgi:hypothetical protein